MAAFGILAEEIIPEVVRCRHRWPGKVIDATRFAIELIRDLFADSRLSCGRFATEPIRG